ncbi:Esterase PHB depolymerase [Mycolicibacterium chlorophenolicum]|uniref:Esterase PHB depolymerase n=1 Tax=Mycolicibacterium chlorophenolicum TaxID=37916 RepID=A0A0J6WB23_9MYCO|nr:Esterase PHB depolymerase [Mycolicibacterium chlorophenolicum]
MIRRTFLRGCAGAGVALVAGSACAATRAAGPAVVQNATALTEVFGDGMKLTAVAVRYDRDINTTTLPSSAFTVAGRNVTRVYANTSPASARNGHDGPWVIVELSAADPAAALWASPQGGGPSSAQPAAPGAGSPSGGPPAAGEAGPAPTIRPAQATITQTVPLSAADGSVAVPTGPTETTDVINAIVDDFQQLRYEDPATGAALDYNLFAPAHFDQAKRYPLVLFMHDASVVGAPPTGPLVQGLGAVSWASPENQSRHECFVLAPQYGTVVIDDTYRPTPAFDATANLVRAVVNQYPIDTNRIYATGQSMGAMMTIGLNLAHPDLFAASYVVAGQWPTDQTAPLSRKRLWITVSEGDDKAYPGENAITALAQQRGATVSRAVWNGQSTQQQFADAYAAITANDSSINYVAFEKGTAIPPGTPAGGSGSEHMSTWHIAYGIPAIRDWIMLQHL